MNIEKLKEEQLKLRKKIILKNSFDEIENIGGCYITGFEEKLIVSLVVLDFKTMEVKDKMLDVSIPNMKYVSGLLGFRVAPAIIDAFTSLDKRPDVMIINANGILHPRKMGAATQIGIQLDVPTIGVAKKLMVGEVKEGDIFIDEEKVGFMVETKDIAKPIYVSPGHKINMSTSLKIIKECIKKHKLPEPLHIAHKYAVKEKKKLK